MFARAVVEQRAPALVRIRAFVVPLIPVWRVAAALQADSVNPTLAAGGRPSRHGPVHHCDWSTGAQFSAGVGTVPAKRDWPPAATPRRGFSAERVKIGCRRRQRGDQLAVTVNHRKQSHRRRFRDIVATSTVGNRDVFGRDNLVCMTALFMTSLAAGNGSQWLFG